MFPRRRAFVRSFLHGPIEEQRLALPYAEKVMANEKNTPLTRPDQGDSRDKSRDPTRPRETDASGDPVDGSGEDNHTQDR